MIGGGTDPENYRMIQHHLAKYNHTFSGHCVAGKIGGLMLADIVFFHVILLLRKLSLQIRVMLVLLLVQQT
jgi:hypothetical protein